MADSYHPLHTSIVRVRCAAGKIVGAGFLAAPGLVCTCAHVIADALDIPRETLQPPEQDIFLDFPFLNAAETTATIQAWVPIKPNDEGGDIAVLRLKAPPPTGAQPARILPAKNFSGRSFEAYGFPGSTDVGQYAYGILRDRLANGYAQLEGTSTQGYRVQPGYSGTPVWDKQGRGIVGMVVASDIDAATKVAFLIPNDLIIDACPFIQPVSRRQLFASLTDGLLGMPLNGVEQFLRVYLGTPEQPAPFGGRIAQLAALNHWLATPGQPYALLVEDAGRGKSALLSHWVATVADEQRAQIVFVPISIRFSTALLGTTVSLLGTRLRHLYQVSGDPPHDIDTWLAEIDTYLREDRSVADRPLLIVLDGADEAINWTMGWDLRFPVEPGSGVKVLISARTLANCDRGGWMRRLEWQGKGVPLDLPLLNRTGVAEVLRSMGNQLTILAPKNDVVGELHRLSGGDPLLVRLYVEALLGTSENTAFLKEEELGQLRPGLEQFFDRWWEDQNRQWGASAPLKEPAVRALLNLFSCALGPLADVDLLTLTEGEQHDSVLLNEAVRPLARFVVGNGKDQGYVFSHSRLSQYFYEKLTPRERTTWEQRFLDFGQHILEMLNSSSLASCDASAYAVRYYGAHLERANIPDRFDELTSNGWLRAWEALEGTYDGFLNDLTRAWKYADTAGAKAESTLARSQIIRRQCRYALITASIRSSAGHLPPDLLREVVAQGVWTPVQGLSHAQKIPEGDKKAHAIVELLPYLSESLREQALQDTLLAVSAISYEPVRVSTLIELIPLLPEWLLNNALVVASAISDHKDRAKVLIKLAAHLPESLRYQIQRAALAAALSISFQHISVSTLIELAPHLSDVLQEEALRDALAVISAFKDRKAHSTAWSLLVPHLSEQLLGDALAVASAIADDYYRAEALTILAPHLPEQLREQALRTALAAAKAVTNPWFRAAQLEDLIPHLPETLRQQALRDALVAVSFNWRGYEDQRVRMLMKLSSHLAEPLREQTLCDALEAARAIAKDEERAYALKALIPSLPETLREQAGLDVLGVAGAITDENSRASFLRTLTPLLPESLRDQALGAALAITKHTFRAYALRDLLPHLPETLHEQALSNALSAALAIPENERDPLVPLAITKHYRTYALINLLPYLSETSHKQVLSEILRATNASAEDDGRADVLIKLAFLLPESLREPTLGDALGAALVIKGNYSRATTLKELLPHLSASLREKALRNALAAASAITEDSQRASVFTGLVPHLNVSLLGEALTMFLTIHDVRSRVAILTKLAPLLPESLLSEALATALVITDVHSRAVEIMKLAPHLSESLFRDTLAASTLTSENAPDVVPSILAPLAEPARGHAIDGALKEISTIVNEFDRASALIRLAPYLPVWWREQALYYALIATATITDDDTCASVLMRLARLLPESLLHNLLHDTWAVISDIPNKLERPTKLATLLHEAARRDALASASNIGNQNIRVSTLMKLVPHLPEPLREQALSEALAAASAFLDEAHLVPAMMEVAPHLSEFLLGNALQTAITSPIRCAPILKILAPYLPTPLLHQALEAALVIPNGYYRIPALTALIPHLSDQLLERALSNVLRTISDETSEYSRILALTRLAPYLPASLREQTLHNIHVATDVSFFQEKRVSALIALAPYLQEPLREQTLRDTLSTGLSLKDKHELVPALTKLIPYLPEPLREQALRDALTEASAFDELSQVKALTGLDLRLTELPIIQLYPLWCSAIHYLATQTRRNLLSILSILSPVVETLGGKDALITLAEAVIEVGRWFP